MQETFIVPGTAGEVDRELEQEPARRAVACRGGRGSSPERGFWLRKPRRCGSAAREDLAHGPHRP